MDLHTIQPTVNEETPNVATAPVTDRVISDSDINKILLQNTFGMENLSRQDKQQLDYVYNYFEKFGFQDMDSVNAEIQLIKNKLGNPPYGLSSLTHVYQYLKVLNQMGQLEEIKKGYEKYGS